MNRKIKMIGLDWDGTLVDCLPRVYRAHILACKRLGLQKPDMAMSVRSSAYGLKAPEMCWGLEGQAADDFRTVYFQYFRAVKSPPPPMPHADRLLTKLHKASVPMVVVSNKPPCMLSDEVTANGWGGLFEYVIGAGEHGRDKPHPDKLDYVSAQTGIPPEESLYAGDTHGDVAAAQAANWQSALVADDTMVVDLSPTLRVQSLQRLDSRIARLVS